jgi:hypothetical protein
MVSKKNTSINDELSINISHLLKRWWYFRKLIVFGTGIVLLLSLFILITFNQAIKSKKYTSSILRGNLNDNNSLIIDTFHSVEIIDRALKVLSLKLNANTLLDHLIIKEGTDPLTASLKNRINSLKSKDIKELALNNDTLNSIVESLDNTSNDIITVEFYHSSLNLKDNEAKNIINKLVYDINKNIELHTTNPNNQLRKIDTSALDPERNSSETISILSNIINSITKNIDQMKTYQNILLDIDLVKIITLTDISKKILFETSKIMGSSYTVEALNTDFITLERDIKDLKDSLLFLERSSVTNNDNINTQKKAIDNLALDGQTFNKILSIGSSLELNEFRLKTLTKIQDLQLQKNQLLAQKELYSRAFEYDVSDLNLESITGRILKLTDDVNRAVTQVYKFTQPKKSVQFIRNPEIVNEGEKLTSSHIKVVIRLTLISFFFLSFIAFFLPRKS